MNREEAFKILEARILELLSRISHLEEENARLQKDLSSKAAQLQAAQAKVNIAAEQLHVELGPVSYTHLTLPTTSRV